MPIRLLVIIGRLDVGGAETHLLQILPRLQALGYEASVYTLGVQGALAPEFRAAGISVTSPPLAEQLNTFPFQLGKPLLLSLCVIRLLVCFQVYRPHIVHFFLPEAYLVGGLCSFSLPGVKRVMSRRSLDHYQARFPLLSRLERWLHSHMDVVLGNSGSVTRQLLNEGVAGNRLGLIYNGVDTSSLEMNIDRSRVRQENNLQDNDLVLILIANLITYKGHEDLLRALGAIRNEMPASWRLLCVGSDNGIGDQLRELAQQLSIGDHIQWLGLRKDTAQLLRISDIGLNCSHQEGFSNSVLEGMAAGLPMVVTNVGGNPEAVMDNVTGIVVPPHDPGKLGRAVLKFANDPGLRESAGNAARNRIREKFSLDACVSKYDRLYRSLVNGERMPAFDNAEDGGS